MDILTDIWTDLHDTNVLWQLAVIALCVLTSYLVSQFLQRRFPINIVAPEDVPAEQSFANLMFPSALCVLLYVGKILLHKWQQGNLLALLIPIVASLVLIRFARYLSRRLFLHSAEISSLHLLIERIFSWGVWLVVIFHYTGFLQDIVIFLDTSIIPIGHNKPSLSDILAALFWVAITVLFALWVSAALEKRLMQVTSLHSSLRLVLSRIGRCFLILFAILISLNLVGIDLTVLSVFGGALGVGLGLGLQKIVNNYVAGFIILLDRSLSINDMITVDKYSGRVSQINTRYTILKGLDGVESIIPNEMLVSSPVQNLSLTDREVLMTTDLTVGYKTDVEALLPLLIDAVSSVDRVSKTNLPASYLVSLGANGLELRVAFWISDPENGRTGVLSQVNREIWKLLQSMNIEVPFPQREIRML